MVTFLVIRLCFCEPSHLECGWKVATWTTRSRNRERKRGLNAQWKVFSHFLYSQRCVYLSNHPVSQSKTTRAATTASTLQTPSLPLSLRLSPSASLRVAGSWFLSLLWDKVLNKGLRLNSITDVCWCYRWTHTCFHLLYCSRFTRLLQYGYMSKRKPEVCFLWIFQTGRICEDFSNETCAWLFGHKERVLYRNMKNTWLITNYTLFSCVTWVDFVHSHFRWIDCRGWSKLLWSSV